MKDKGHFRISIAKSLIRIIGYSFLFIEHPYVAVFLAVAEVGGILEEVADKR